MWHGIRYMLTHGGLMSDPPYDVTAFVRTRENLTRPDAQIVIGNMSMSIAEEGFTVDVSWRTNRVLPLSATTCFRRAAAAS